MLKTASISCSQKSSVSACSSQSRLTRATISRRPPVSMPAVGSPSSSTLGRRASAIAKPAFRFLDIGVRGAAKQAKRMPVAREQRDLHVLQRREVRKDAGDLEGA